MLRTVLEMTVHTGREAEFRAVWLETARAAARLPGSVAQTLLQDPHRPGVHVIMADWADQASLDAFQKSPERKELTSRLEHFRSAAQKRVFEAVEHVPAHHNLER